MEDNEIEDIVNQIIDQYLLNFLDEFENVFDRLPNDGEKALWSSGFLDGLYAMKEAMMFKKSD